MAPTTIRKAIGTVKDQTSISIAKVASNMAPELEVAIVKATSHDDEPPNQKYIQEILSMTSHSRGYVNACVTLVSRRLGKTRDWIVALKTLMVIHRLLDEGDPLFQEEILHATRKGTRLLNMSDFRDEAHSSSWDHSAFIKTFAMYLDQRLEFILSPQQQRGYEYSDQYNGEYNRGESGYGMPRRTRSYGDMNELGGKEGREDKKTVTPLREMKPERIFGKMGHLQRLLDRFLSCRPTGMAKNNRMILIALYPVVKESFQLYAEICEVLAVLLDKFFDMEYPDCVKAFDAYASAAKQIDELVAFYNWCKDTGVARSSEYPEVQRITGKLLETLEEFLRDRSKRPKSPERREEAPPVPQEEEPVPDMNEIKALPPPENYTPPPPEPEPKPQQPQFAEDLVNLRDDTVTADDQGNRFALALFAGPSANNGNGSWEAFPSNGEPQMTSAWQTPAAEPGKADWELALVETASNLSQQKAALGGGFDPLLLNGMYDQGMVRQHVGTAQLSGGSASSVALPGSGKSATPVLALPAPDGTVQAVNQDPFAASLSVPPPSYVQMADMEKKQNLLVQEQVTWQQYAREGMQGQASLVRIGGTGHYNAGPTPMMPYGMPPVNGMGQPPAGAVKTLMTIPARPHSKWIRNSKIEGARKLEMEEQWRLYEAYNELHGLAQELKTPFDAPAVLVVGHQTDGKSALVEGLMGFQFNHVGGGTKTRRPITLHMKYDPECEVPTCHLVSDDDPTFAQEKSLHEIQAYIESENMRLEKESFRFSAKEIIIRVEYKHCPNLTIIDTPGLIAPAPGRKNQALQSQAHAVESLVRAKMQHKEFIILCLEDCSDWSNATTRRVVMQIDPELSRTIVVSTKLDTRIPQFARASDVEVFLSPPAHTLDGFILGDSPFFTSVPSGRVGSGHDSVYSSNDDFKQAISLREVEDIASLEEKLGRPLSMKERNRIGVSKLRSFLEELLQKRYMDSVPLIIPLLEKEYRTATRKLNEINKELSTLDEVKLKEKGRKFHDLFITKLSLLLKGTVVAPPDKFGETLQDERSNGGAFVGTDGLQFPLKLIPDYEMIEVVVDCKARELLRRCLVGRALTFDSQPLNMLRVRLCDVKQWKSWGYMPLISLMPVQNKGLEKLGSNTGMRLYGGAQYHRAMAEFRFVVGGIKCPQITREEIVNACGVEDIHDGTNYSRTACVIAVAKARDTFEPFLHQAMSKQKPASKEACLLTGKLYPLDAFKLSAKLGCRLLYVLKRLLPISVYLLQKDGEYLSGHDVFLKRVDSAFSNFAESTERACREKCMEDLESTTRYVTWSLHNKNRAGLRQFLDSFGGTEQSVMGVNPISASLESSMVSAANDKHDNRPRADVKLSHLASGIDSSSAVQTTETRLADLLDKTLWNRRLAPSSERIVYGLVQQIFHGIREYFLASAELKFNCFLLMPVVDKLPALLLQDLESAFVDDLDNVFDITNLRHSFSQQKLETEMGLKRIKRLKEKFRLINEQLTLHQLKVVSIE
ncbi:hypothetical protein SADUNF_Sadunf06G0204900 [Salix dunnii]|uniref:ENTH domain-containing protein n=2 Tax=Salix TaxID=40685 RepID=A0A835K1C3_9ROSI|nr:hypothetical protein SADUNF_Sadunf06G0204900 [Salix dunnii]